MNKNIESVVVFMAKEFIACEGFIICPGKIEVARALDVVVSVP